MDDYLILARSVTFAQRMQKALSRASGRNQIYRAPRDLTDLGCAYVVRIGPQDLRLALPVLNREGLGPWRVSGRQGTAFREESLCASWTARRRPSRSRPVGRGPGRMRWQP